MRKPKKTSSNFNHSVSAVSPNPAVFGGPQASIRREISTTAQKRWDEDTLLFGENDALPLVIANAVAHSPSTASCISTRAQFIKGAGFSDKELMKFPMDSEGTTLWDLHCRLADTLALFEGFSVNFKFEKSGKILSTFYLPFEGVRLVQPGENSPIINRIKYNPYFGTQEWKQEYTKAMTLYTPKKAAEEISSLTKDQLSSWPGMAYYYGKTSPLSRFYPKPKYWSAKETIEAEAQLQEFLKNELENGFFQSVALTMIGDPNQPSSNPKYQIEEEQSDGRKKKRSTKTVGEEFNEVMAANFSGPKKAGTVWVTWATNDKEAPIVSEFPSKFQSDQLTATRDAVIKIITIATEVPSILANISEGVSLGSGGSEMQKAIELMQSRTAEFRSTLENFYNTVLFPNLSKRPKSDVKIVSYNPITEPVVIEDKFWDQLSSKEKRDFVKTTYPQIKFDDLGTDQAPSKRTLIEIIGVGGSQALMNVLTQFAENKLTESQASNTLQILFGISPIDAARMLQKEPVNTSTQTPETTQQTVNNTQSDPNQEAIDKLIRSLSRAELNKFYGYVNDYKKGRATLEQTMVFLRAYKLTDDQINLFLNDPEGDGPP